VDFPEPVAKRIRLENTTTIIHHARQTSVLEVVETPASVAMQNQTQPERIEGAMPADGVRIGEGKPVSSFEDCSVLGSRDGGQVHSEDGQLPEDNFENDDAGVVDFEEASAGDFGEQPDNAQLHTQGGSMFAEPQVWVRSVVLPLLDYLVTHHSTVDF